MSVGNSIDDELDAEQNSSPDEPAEFRLDSQDENPLLVLENSVGDENAKQGLMRWDEALTLEGQIEAILFASPKPMSIAEIVEVLREEDREPDAGLVESHVTSLVKLYKERNGGFRLEYDKGVGYQFRTVPAAAPLMEKMFSSRQRPLSRAALETLAIIAYRQPVTRADIEYIRGVDAGSIIKNLLERDLIACVGRKEDSGRPMMFGTTEEFLRVFRLPNLNELPPLSAFQPAPDIMAEAIQKLEDQPEDVDVDEFMSDPDLSAPSVSDGLASSGQLEDLANDLEDIQVIDAEAEVGLEAIARAGASFDREGSESNYDREEDTNSEVDVSNRLGFSSGSGADDPAGAHISQREHSSRDGDKD